MESVCLMCNRWHNLANIYRPHTFIRANARTYCVLWNFEILFNYVEYSLFSRDDSVQSENTRCQFQCWNSFFLRYSPFSPSQRKLKSSALSYWITWQMHCIRYDHILSSFISIRLFFRVLCNRWNSTHKINAELNLINWQIRKIANVINCMQ